MIDWVRVRELRDEVGAADFDDIVALFLEEVESTLDALAEGPPAPEDLHFLKGSALNLGFHEMASLCASDARPDPPDKAALAAVFAESRRQFVDGLATHLAA